MRIWFTYIADIINVVIIKVNRIVIDVFKLNLVLNIYLLLFFNEIAKLLFQTLKIYFKIKYVLVDLSCRFANYLRYMLLFKLVYYLLNYKTVIIYRFNSF